MLLPLQSLHLKHSPASRVDKIFGSYAFGEGWAHYAEELCFEEGFRADDPRYAIGMCIWSLVRVTRLARGLPVGGDLDYVDGVTLAHALTARQDMR